MFLTPLFLDGSIEHVPVVSPGCDQPSVNPFFLRSQREHGFLCPSCRGEISYAEVLYSDHHSKARADVFGLMTGDSLCASCPCCGQTVHYMFQNPPEVLAMCLGSGPSFSARSRSLSRRVRGFILSFLIRAFSPASFVRS